jgi:phosphatidylserine/phosphatidylglycerophosphate/cardiolipin synthase-like enzyme
MRTRLPLISRLGVPRPGAAMPSGMAELVIDQQHFAKVVLEGILEAKISLDIATADFKAMLIPLDRTRRGPQPERGRRSARSIVRVLGDLAERGVEVRVLHAGVPSSPALRELRRGLPPNLTMRRCPRLHAKAIIVDARAMYLGSANLTGAGLGAKADGRRNFEMGIWTTATPLIDGVMQQFNALWEGRQCTVCRRRDVCPVPLEEPHLA